MTFLGRGENLADIYDKVIYIYMIKITLGRTSVPTEIIRLQSICLFLRPIRFMFRWNQRNRVFLSEEPGFEKHNVQIVQK